MCLASIIPGKGGRLDADDTRESLASSILKLGNTLQGSFRVWTPSGRSGSFMLHAEGHTCVPLRKL